MKHTTQPTLRIPFLQFSVSLAARRKRHPSSVAHLLCALSFSAARLLCGVLPVSAAINPQFTPIHLVAQSTTIAALQLDSAKDGKLTLSVKQILKGALAAKQATFDLSEAPDPEQAKSLEKKLGAGQKDVAAMLFIGELPTEGNTDAAPDDAANHEKAFLQIERQWFLFSRPAKTPAWKICGSGNSMLATWNGDSEMLQQCVAYVLAEKDDARVPSEEGVKWGDVKNCGAVKGAVSSAISVTLASGGQPALFVASDAGDAIFEYDAVAKNLIDTSARHKLASKSKVATAADINGDGRLDIVSYDGSAITVFTQDAQSIFHAGVQLPKDVLKEGCVSLAIVDCGKSGHPGVVVSTKAATLLWIPDEKGPQVPVTLNGATAPAKELGAPGRCLVADLDGDSMPDILQLFANGSLFFKGKALGQFAAPQPCKAALASGRADAFLGDFDADGRLDIFTTGDATQLWNNRGKGEFVDTMSGTGELAYKGNAGTIGGMTGDMNNDGLQDAFFFSAAGTPLLFFNRGFRSFGFANSLDYAAALPEAGNGVQAGCWDDFNGDGILEQVLVLLNGEVYILNFDNGEGVGRGVRVMLPNEGPFQGPLTVTGYRNGRSLGAWNVSAGISAAFIARSDAGPLKITWKLPGQAEQSKEFVLENTPQTFVIKAGETKK